jgi:hypothetical protein
MRARQEAGGRRQKAEGRRQEEEAGVTMVLKQDLVL